MLRYKTLAFNFIKVNIVMEVDSGRFRVQYSWVDSAFSKSATPIPSREIAKPYIIYLWLPGGNTRHTKSTFNSRRYTDATELEQYYER